MEDIFQSMGFYKGFRSSEAYNNFLESSPSIEEVLQHESTTDEVLCGNPKLIEYLTVERLSTLIQYIIEEPEDTSSNAYKFPFVACEFFTQDFGQTLDLFFTEHSLLSQLFSFLSQEHVNLTSAGYFAKAVGCLITHNSPALASYVFEGNWHKLLLKHMYSLSVSDIVYSLLSAHESEHSAAMLEDLCRILSRDLPTSYNVEGVFAKLASEEQLNNYSDRARNFLNICIEQLNTDDKWTIKYTARTIKHCLHDFRPLADYLDTLICVLKRPPEIITTSSGTVPALGEEKLSIIDLLDQFFSKTEQFEVVIQSGILGILTQLFKDYEQNSFLQKMYTSIVTNVLKKEELFNHLVHSTDLFQIIIDIDQGKLTSLPYAYKIAKEINRAEEMTEHSEEWNCVLENMYRYFDTEKQPLGGKHPNQIGNRSSGEDILTMEQIFGPNAFEDDDFLDIEDSSALTAKDLEDLPDLFDMQEQKSKRQNVYSSTFCMNNATFDEFENMEFMQNHFWKLLPQEELEELE